MTPPAWTQLDLARAVAVEFAGALKECNPERYEVLVNAARGIGQGWVAPRPDTVGPGERLSTKRASEEYGVPEGTLRRWASDPAVPVWRQYGGFDGQEILAYQASKRAVLLGGAGVTRRRGHR